ncbi:hypothetical protein [Brevundimonas sp.]|uniref:hypothetical protein n=1 Tax=Brevundimonas sp. TaxID=1871086 RepID=UPI003D0BE96D
MTRTFTDEELTPRGLAFRLDLFRRAEASAQNTRAEISKTQTRLHNLSNDLVVLENEIEEAAAFAEAYLLRQRSLD